MKITHVVIFFAFVVYVYAQCGGTPSCNNPMGQNSQDFWGEAFYLTEPATTNANEICGDVFKSGEQQCCSDLVYQGIERGFIKARAKVDAAMEILRLVKGNFTLMKDNFEKAKDEIRKSDLPQETKDRYVKLIDDLVAAVERFLGSILRNYASCLTKILQYWVGLFCLGCSTKWDCFVEFVNSVPRVLLDLLTCQDLYDGCRGFLEAFIQLFVDIANSFADVPELGSNPFTLSDICNGDCKNFVCFNIVAGQQSNLNAVDVSDSFGKRSDAKVFKHADDMPSLQELGHGLRSIQLTAVSLIHALKIAESKERGTGVSEGVYQDGGWEATTVGGKSSLDTQVNSGSALMSWLNWF